MGKGYAKQKKQARQMQEQLEKLQQQMQSVEVTGTAGNGLVTLTLGGENDMKNPLISPIYGDCSRFPPTYLVSGTRDLFLSNTVRAHRKLRNAGVIAHLNVYEGISHGQWGFVFDSPENIQVHTELGEFLDKYLK